mgnify:CR=1 FL=1
MKKVKNILVYNYDYSRLGFTLEGEFFISSIFTFQTEIKAKSKRDFLIQYSQNLFYSFCQLKILVKKYEHLISWDKRLNQFRMDHDKWILRKELIIDSKEIYLSVPGWLFILNRSRKFNFTQLYILSLAVSCFYKRKHFEWANETIAHKLGMKSRKSISDNVNKLKKIGLIEVTPTNRANILYVTDKLLDYEHFRKR